VDFYEVGVYLAIIVVACTCVFGVMWLLIRSMQPKRPRAQRRVAPAVVAAGKTPKQIPQESSQTIKEKKATKNKREKKKKDSNKEEEKLLTLRELPDNRLLPLGDAKASAKEVPANVNEKPAEEQREQSKATEDEKKHLEKVVQESPADASAQENTDVTLPDLPSLDTLSNEEDAPQKEEEVDLMSVFQSEEAEDSSTSDLAANLFDVDLQNIEKLGSEVSEFLGGMRSK